MLTIDRSCGSITFGKLNMGDTSMDPNNANICETLKTTGNFCQTKPYLNGDETIFVAADCNEHWPEPFASNRDHISSKAGGRM